MFLLDVGDGFVLLFQTERCWISIARETREIFESMEVFPLICSSKMSSKRRKNWQRRNEGHGNSKKMTVRLDGSGKRMRYHMPPYDRNRNEPNYPKKQQLERKPDSRLSPLFRTGTSRRHLLLST